MSAVGRPAFRGLRRSPFVVSSVVLVLISLSPHTTTVCAQGCIMYYFEMPANSPLPGGATSADTAAQCENQRRAVESHLKQYETDARSDQSEAGWRMTSAEINGLGGDNASKQSAKAAYDRARQASDEASTRMESASAALRRFPSSCQCMKMAPPTPAPSRDSTPSRPQPQPRRSVDEDARRRSDRREVEKLKGDAVKTEQDALKRAQEADASVKAFNDAAAQEQARREAEAARAAAAEARRRAAILQARLESLTEDAGNRDAQFKAVSIQQGAAAKQAAQKAATEIVPAFKEGSMAFPSADQKLELVDASGRPAKAAPATGAASRRDVTPMLQRRLDALRRLKAESNSTFDELQGELQKEQRDLKVGSDKADATAELALALKDVTQIVYKGYKSLKLTGKALDTATREIALETLEFAYHTPLETAVEKAAEDRFEKPKATDGIGMAVAVAAVKSWSDLQTPSFWDTFAVTWLNDSSRWWDVSALSRAIDAGTQGPEALLLQAKARIEAQRQQTNRTLDARIAETQRLLTPVAPARGRGTR